MCHVIVQVTTPHGATGVRMICPGCRSNKAVVPPGTSGGGFPVTSADKVSKHLPLCFSKQVAEWQNIRYPFNSRRFLNGMTAGVAVVPALLFLSFHLCIVARQPPNFRVASFGYAVLLRFLKRSLRTTLRQVRTIHDVGGRMVVPLVGRYTCKNWQCPLVLSSAKKAAKGRKANVVDHEWDKEKILAYCPNGATFNTMTDR